MYNLPHAIHLKVAMLKQINNCPKDYIFIFIAFMFRNIFT